MPQAARKIWTEEIEREDQAIRRPKKRSRKAARAHVNTTLRAQALTLFLIFAFTAAVTLIRNEVSAMRGYELVELRRTAIQLENENKELEVQIAQLRAPQRIKDIAINHLGMVVPQEFYFAAESK